jgi:AraC-like DNA-binding protein
MDALSEMLGAIRLTGAVFLDVELRAQWSYLTAPARRIADVLMPDADHVIPFHLVSEGSCYARLADDSSPVELHSGDVILFPAGDRHVLATSSEAALYLKPIDITGESLDKLLKRGEIAALKKGRSGETTRIVCGFLACDRKLAEPLLRSLPRLLKVSMRDGGTAAWVHSSIQFSVAQTGSSSPGSAVILARLSEVLFAEAIRQYTNELPTGESGLAGLRDRYVGRALSLLHEQPAHAWTLVELATKAGLSRSALGKRFNELIGAPPMQYLTRWRTSLAATQLRDSDVSILRVATDVGYESEAAFNRAFKREFGLPPAAWRKQAARSAGRSVHSGI